MDARVEKLRDWGCDVKGALARVLNDEEFYLECLVTIPDDPNFEELEKALRARDVEGAFDYAHALKGVLSNVGLTPMYEKSVEIVEPLRAGRCDGSLLDRLAELCRMRDHLSEILRSRRP